MLTKYNIKTEVTVTDRSSIARFTFPKGEANILMNLGELVIETQKSDPNAMFINNISINGKNTAYHTRTW